MSEISEPTTEPTASAYVSSADESPAEESADEESPAEESADEESADEEPEHDEQDDAPRSSGSLQDRLENEGDIAADYLEELLDIADLDGDLDMDVEGERAVVSIVGADLSQLVRSRGCGTDTWSTVGSSRRSSPRALGWRTWAPAPDCPGWCSPWRAPTCGSP
jgi:hypothetical protein